MRFLLLICTILLIEFNPAILGIPQQGYNVESNNYIEKRSESYNDLMVDDELESFECEKSIICRTLFNIVRRSTNPEEDRVSFQRKLAKALQLARRLKSKGMYGIKNVPKGPYFYLPHTKTFEKIRF